MASKLPDIYILSHGQSFQTEKEVNLLDELTRRGIVVPSPCGGTGICKKCTVWVEERSTKLSDFSVFSSLEECRKAFPLREELACQYFLEESIVLWVPEYRAKLQIMADSASDRNARLFGPPTVRSVPIQYDSVRNGGILTEAELLHQHGITEYSLAQIAVFPEQWRNAQRQGHVTAFLERLIAFQSKNTPPVTFVLAVDLGTTTLAAAILDAESAESMMVISRGNPQRIFGDDVISRLQKASESAESRKKLQQVVVREINDMLAEMTRKLNIPPERIAAMTLAGNTVMEQLFCGIDSTNLGLFPFTPALKEYPLIPAGNLGINIHPDGVVMIFPVIGGFVGGDIVSGILATRMTEQPQPSLLIDVGTNGEMSLWHNGKLTCSATAAGPAFEGAGIEQGMVAEAGAIEQVDIEQTVDGPKVKIQTIGNVSARGICGSGLIDAAAELLRTGIILPSGQMLTREKLHGKFSAGMKDRLSDLDKQRYFILAKSSNGTTVRLTQKDIRQLQLAAGAIRTGITLLLRQANLREEDLQTVYLAGGFGNYIRRENAQRLGILPSGIPVERIRFCGNTSLAGAKQVLLSRDRYETALQIARLAQHVDLAAFPDFQEVFTECMTFP
ncbi:MAG: ASKHA domain-containing protein [Planctomycetaceae bacterium]|jgi:uncharacterized 2Fe-2S/4Fe-4S cluster protein (DUF4445 family)|nr:ASKHA domain-containing protein [Planctomycetaceae bacterium]